MPMPNVTFSDMTPEQQAALPVDAATGLRVVASARKGGLTWVCLEDGTERVTDADGNPAVWEDGP